MAERRITESDIGLVLAYGRVYYKDGMRVFAIGRRDAVGIPVTERRLRAVTGLQVCTSQDGTIISVYRNHDVRTLRLISENGRVRSRSLCAW